MNGHVFISYGQEDWDRAQRVAEYLKNCGWTMWVAPHQLRGAADWADRIHEAVRTCRVFLLLISPNSMHSGYVLKELYVAVDAARTVVPAMIESAQVPPSVQYLISGAQLVDVSDLAEWQLEDLTQAIGAIEQKKQPVSRGWSVPGVLGNVLTGLGTIILLTAMGIILLNMQEIFSSASRMTPLNEGARLFQPFLLFFFGMVIAAAGQGLRRLARRR